MCVEVYLLRLLCPMALFVFACFAIASLGPGGETTVVPTLVLKPLRPIHQQRQQPIQPVETSLAPVEPTVDEPTKPPREWLPPEKQRLVASFVPWDGGRGLERWQSASFSRGAPKSVFAWKRAPRPASPAGDECLGHGVYDPRLEECRCTAGWAGRMCQDRALRPCNSAQDPRARLNSDALCAGNCDDERGLCYCAGHKTPFQRSLPHVCAPAVTPESKLPDGRPLYPVRAATGAWEMAPVIWERSAAAWTKNNKHQWGRPWAKPIEAVYGKIPGNPKLRPTGPQTRVGWCEATPNTRDTELALRCNGCYEGRTGPYCEQPKEAFCQRDCSGYGRCDSGFCWCRDGWFGVDCSQHLARPRGAPLLQARQRLPSRAAASPLRVFVYDMPAEFTTRNLQWRNGPTMGVHRSFDGTNRSFFAAGSLYAMETALHEWLLDSPLRTTDAAEAQLFFVPLYLASLLMWPISKWADVPYYGREKHENKRRSHQGALFMLAALRHIRDAYPFWDASGGRDHVWMMLHDEGPCFCPRDIRPSILLTHYGYHAARPRPWGTYYDDNFLQDPGFYDRYLGDANRPTPCFQRRKDLVISPWKTPDFWRKALADPALRGATAFRRQRTGLVFFAGDLGSNRLPGYSHDLRQIAHALYCDPRRMATRRDCTPIAGGKCRKDLPMNCSGWVPGVTITTHSRRYHDELKEHTFCLAFPGDGWSSRVLDAVTHGCIPVVVQDESEMFFEGAFADAGLPLDYANFSVQKLRAVPAARIVELRKAGLWVRDYFIYKDMYNPSAEHRRVLLATGRPGQDGFLLLALALEARARALGRLSKDEGWRERNRALLDFDDQRPAAAAGTIVEADASHTSGEGGSPRRMLRDFDEVFGATQPEALSGKVEVWE